jgi:hypothetical protein
MEIIVDVLIIVLVLVVSNSVTKLKKATDEDREMLMLLLKDSLKVKMVEMKKGLEDLMNHKTDVKKTTTNRKTK